jgi:hypothetical protein
MRVCGSELAPIPSASVSTTVSVNAGDFAKLRKAKRVSWMKSSNQWMPQNVR